MHDFTLVDSQRKTKTKNIASKLKKKKKQPKIIFLLSMHDDFTLLGSHCLLITQYFLF